MKKAKKITTGIVLSTILGSTAIAVGGTLINSSLTNNVSTSVEDKKVENNSDVIRATRIVDYDAHTIDGEKLEPSNFLLGEDGNIQYYDIYTNVDQTTHKFPNNKPSRVMVIIKRLTPS